MTDPSQDANNNHEEANASGLSNTEILNAIRSLKKDFGQQSADMLEAINSIKGDLLSQSRRIDETEEEYRMRRRMSPLSNKKLNNWKVRQRCCAIKSKIKKTGQDTLT